MEGIKYLLVGGATIMIITLVLLYLSYKLSPSPSPSPSLSEIFCPSEYPVCYKDGNCVRSGCEDGYKNCPNDILRDAWFAAGEFGYGNYIIGTDNLNPGCDGDYRSNGPNPCPESYPECNSKNNCTKPCGGAQGTPDQCTDTVVKWTNWQRATKIPSPTANIKYLSPGCTKDYSST